jgi:hypothetical protein
MKNIYVKKTSIIYKISEHLLSEQSKHILILINIFFKDKYRRQGSNKI